MVIHLMARVERSLMAFILIIMKVGSRAFFKQLPLLEQSRIDAVSKQNKMNIKIILYWSL